MNIIDIIDRASGIFLSVNSREFGMEQKAQSWLVLNLPVFMFVCIHVNVPPTRIADLVRNV